MPTVDFTSAYRDATKGSTIKALQQRRAEMEAANIERKPRPVANVWQGAANVADTISGAIREGRLANQEAAGRERFAQLLAGGLAPDEIGEALGLDPETTMKFQERTWAKEDTTTENQRKLDEELRKHGYDVEAATARVEADRKAQEALFGHQDTSAETLAGTQEAAAKAEDARAADEKMRQEAAAADEKKRQEAAETDIGPETAARETEWRRLNPNGDINSPEAQSYILRNAAEPTGGFGGPAGIKAMQDFQHEGNIYTTGLNDINEAKALVPQALTGDIGKKVAELASSGGEAGIAAAVYGAEKLGYPITREQIQATVRLYQIMDNVATTRMSNTLKGQSSNLEMEKFTRIFANPGATPEAKLQALVSLEQAFIQDRNAVSATIQSAGGQALTPYEYKPVTGGMDTPAAAAAPVPAMEPGDEEGDTGSDEHGKLKVVGGKWTRVQ